MGDLGGGRGNGTTASGGQNDQPVKMALLKRFDALEVATADLADAVSTYQRNFGFELKGDATGEGATLKVGDAEIRLVAGAAATAAIAATGEGLAAIWLEAEDIDQVAAALRSAGIQPPAIRIESGRRVIAIDPKLANQVPLFIFDRKPSARSDGGALLA